MSIRALLPLLALLAACPRPRAPASPSSQPASVLQRRDPPPPGVPAHRTVGLHGMGMWTPCPPVGMSCRNGECWTPTRFEVSGRHGPPSVLEPIQICLQGIGSGPVSLVLSPPRGKSRRLRVVPGERGLDQRVMLPPGPPGVYSVNAEQRARRFSTTIAVRAVAKPRLQLYPADAKPGQRVQLTLAGAEPRRSVAIRVYGPLPLDGDQLEARYITTLQLTTNPFGQALSALQSHRSDPPGHYYVVLDDLEAELRLAP